MEKLLKQDMSTEEELLLQEVYGGTAERIRDIIAADVWQEDGTLVHLNKETNFRAQVEHALQCTDHCRTAFEQVLEEYGESLVGTVQDEAEEITTGSVVEGEEGIPPATLSQEDIDFDGTVLTYKGQVVGSVDMTRLSNPVWNDTMGLWLES